MVVKFLSGFFQGRFCRGAERVLLEGVLGGGGVVFWGTRSRVLFPEGRLRYAISYEAARGA